MRRRALKNGNTLSAAFIAKDLVKKRGVPCVERNAQNDLPTVVIAKMPPNGLCIRKISRLSLSIWRRGESHLLF